MEVHIEALKSEWELVFISLFSPLEIISILGEEDFGERLECFEGQWVSYYHLNPGAGPRTIKWAFHLKLTALVGSYIWQGNYLRLQHNLWPSLNISGKVSIHLSLQSSPFMAELPIKTTSLSPFRHVFLSVVESITTDVTEGIWRTVIVVNEAILEIVIGNLLSPHVGSSLLSRERHILVKQRPGQLVSKTQPFYCPGLQK